MDWMSKSDPMCVLYEQDAQGEWIERSRTEGIKNNHAPVFATKIEMEYHFEHKQKIRFDIVDVDDPKKAADLRTAELIGSVEATVAKVVGSKHGRFEAALTNRNQGEGKKYGTIIVIAEAQKGRTGDKVKMVLEGVGLAAKDGMFGKSDPYFVFKRLRRGTEEVAFEYKSEYIKQNLNPVWEPAYMCFSEMCNGDLDEKIKLEVWDYDSASSPDMIGWLDVSLNDLLKKEPLKLNDRPGGRTADPGSIKAQELTVHRTPNFLDYIMEGCDLTISVAVDFTASNKNIEDPVSLHHVSEEQQNQYQQAMTSVGSVILDYDHDKQVGAMGFGAIVPGAEEASHCFPLKFDSGPGEYNVDGIEGLMQSYSDAISKVKLYGPTNFQNVIDQQALMAKECQKSAYHILMILTDGDITDKQETIAAIVRASHVPMSIIIIGVGDEDFEEMDILDSDKGMLEDEAGNKAARDIVQFVPFKKHPSATELETNLLSELPGQLLGYMWANKRTPGSWKETAFTLPEGQWFK